MCFDSKDFDILERLVLSEYYRALGLLVQLERDEEECVNTCRLQREEVSVLDRLFHKLRTERFEQR